MKKNRLVLILVPGAGEELAPELERAMELARQLDADVEVLLLAEGELGPVGIEELRSR